MDYDFRTASAFWSERRRGRIRKYSHVGHSSTVVVRDLDRPHQLAFDWLARNLYYVDGDANIDACDERGAHCALVLQTAVADVSALALAPEFGYMFWAVRANGLGKMP